MEKSMQVPQKNRNRATIVVVQVIKSCLTLCNPMDCSLPGSSIYVIFQAKVLEWGAIAFSKKNIYFCFIDYAKAFDCVDHKKLWKILKKMGIPDHLNYLKKPVCRSGSNS